MIKLACQYCKKIIIEDIEKYLKDYPNENYVQCPYCSNYIFVEDIKKEFKK